jgi:hypothetical protein
MCQGGMKENSSRVSKRRGSIYDEELVGRFGYETFFCGWNESGEAVFGVRAEGIRSKLG